MVRHWTIVLKAQGSNPVLILDQVSIQNHVDRYRHIYGKIPIACHVYSLRELRKKTSKIYFAKNIPGFFIYTEKISSILLTVNMKEILTVSKCFIKYRKIQFPQILLVQKCNTRILRYFRPYYITSECNMKMQTKGPIQSRASITIK